jgi:hypothetical protein
MSTKISQPITKAHYMIVLWGEKFDEDVATFFTTEARRVGLCAKVVGLTGAQAAGGNGLVITADLTLSQAMRLADKAICVVVPCSPAILQRIEDDPRVPKFFQQANSNHAMFVVSHPDTIKRSSLKDLQMHSSQISFYSDYQNFIEFVRQTVQSLSTVA